MQVVFSVKLAYAKELKNGSHYSNQLICIIWILGISGIMYLFFIAAPYGWETKAQWNCITAHTQECDIQTYYNDFILILFLWILFQHDLFIFIFTFVVVPLFYP